MDTVPGSPGGPLAKGKDPSTNTVYARRACLACRGYRAEGAKDKEKPR